MGIDNCHFHIHNGSILSIFQTYFASTFRQLSQLFSRPTFTVHDSYSARFILDLDGIHQSQEALSFLYSSIYFLLEVRLVSLNKSSDKIIIIFWENFFTTDVHDSDFNDHKSCMDRISLHGHYQKNYATPSPCHINISICICISEAACH